MDIKPNYPCKCGHVASYHEEERKSLDLDAIDPIVIVTKIRGKCGFDKADIPVTPLSDGVSGYGFDYTNFGRWCHCQEFKLDNLKFLELQANENA